MIIHQKEIKPVIATPNVTISAERIIDLFLSTLNLLVNFYLIMLMKSIMNITDIKT